MVTHQFPSNDDCAAALVISATDKTAARVPLMLFVRLLIGMALWALSFVEGVVNPFS